MNNFNQESIIKEINERYGEDLTDFEKFKQIYGDLLVEKTKIEEKINLQNEQSNLRKIINKAEKVVVQCDNSIEQSKIVINEVEENLSSVECVRRELEKRFDELNALETALQYMRVIKQIEALSEDLERGYRKIDDEYCVTIYANLCEISRNLSNFRAKHLRNHLKETIYYWHDVLKTKLSKDFDGVLKSIKWPFVSTNFSLQLPHQNDIEKLQIISEYLLQIELPNELNELKLINEQLSLPINLLILPLRKRFLYHFYGNRQTNRIDKPEWYFTQILTWIRDHLDFVIKWIQPIVDKLGHHHIDAKIEFIRGLVQLSIDKFNTDLPTIQFDDYTFSHSVDEALSFYKELRETYNYPINQASILNVLTQPKVLTKWMMMEKKFATEKMDAMLSSTDIDPFDSITTNDDNDNNDDNIKITACSEAFIILLQTITDRYECLPQPGHRLQFLELQLELLDDFRIRLIQIINVEQQQQDNLIETKIPLIANTIFYIENVLIDWGAMLHYLNLYYYKNQLENIELEKADYNDLDNVENDTVFAEMLSLYRRLRCDILKNLSEHVLYEIKQTSKQYRREQWFCMRLNKNFQSLSLTPSACTMFEMIAKHLHQLQKYLTPKLFTIVWHTIAQLIDDYLFDNLILDSRFNDCGALQLKYDITRNLCPLFSQFTEKPETYFPQLIESCVLLNLAKGSALLLRETLLALEGADGVEDTRQITLREIGVYHFTPTMAVKVLNQRTDITVNRLNVD